MIHLQGFKLGGSAQKTLWQRCEPVVIEIPVKYTQNTRHCVLVVVQSNHKQPSCVTVHNHIIELVGMQHYGNTKIQNGQLINKPLQQHTIHPRVFYDHQDSLLCENHHKSNKPELANGQIVSSSSSDGLAQPQDIHSTFN